MSSSVVAAVAALVAIHVSPDVPPELSAAAVRSCEIALGEQQCVPGDTPAPVARWQVTVTSLEDHRDGVRIDLRQDPTSPVLMTRDITFVTEDAPRERWASIGVLIAALVVAESRDSEPIAAPEPAPRSAPPEQPTPPPAHPSPRIVARLPPRGSWRLDLHALVSRRLERGSPELGARLRVSVLPTGGRWFGLVSVAGASRLGDEPSVSWLGGSAGPGFRLGDGASVVAAEFTAGGVAEYWSVGASEPGRSERVGAFRLGGFGGAEALWAVHPSWILALGAEARLAVPPLRVEVSGRAVERVPELGGFIFAGLRVIP